MTIERAIRSSEFIFCQTVPGIVVDEALMNLLDDVGRAKTSRPEENWTL